jgi:hypothetical protein
VGDWEQGAEEDVWNQAGGSNRLKDIITRKEFNLYAPSVTDRAIK